MYSAMAALAASRVGQRCRASSSRLRVAKKLSTTASKAVNRTSAHVSLTVLKA
jgi:hypothetical protein